ncbi:hypothetical protein GCM10010289_85590 [Streptomyces violascens]|nr:hypothetical protein GCM10010289_85590 [Streptomyces violascens]
MVGPEPIQDLQRDRAQFMGPIEHNDRGPYAKPVGDRVLGLGQPARTWLRQLQRLIQGVRQRGAVAGRRRLQPHYPPGLAGEDRVEGVGRGIGSSTAHAPDRPCLRHHFHDFREAPLRREIRHSGLQLI